VKVWCYFGADGRICADSHFQSADDTWRVMLGWPTRGEVAAAKERGDHVVQIDIPEGKSDA
jgi:hypothetical protein